ncbi:MAG: hypothetical protein AB1847_22510 [bacterium]
MKETVISWLVLSLLLGGVLFSVSKAEAVSRDNAESVQNIFVDTLYGMATGFVLGAAITAARGDADSSDWGQNLGAGAAVGGILGLGYGVFYEYNRGFAELTGTGISLHIPSITTSSARHGEGLAIRADFLQIHF